MKILFLAASFYPSIGGVETHVLKVANELRSRGHKVTVITEQNALSKQSKTQNDNVPIKIKSTDKSTFFIHKKLHQNSIYYFKFGQPGFFKKFRIWYMLLRNYKLIEEADIVHCHDVFIWYLPFRFLFLNKKVFTTFHGYEGRFPPVEKSIWIRKMSEHLSFGNICIGEFITRWYGTKPDYISYGGVEKARLPKPKEPRKNLKILLIGRLAKDIGVQIYRDCLKQLKKEKIPFEFTACGEGELRHELEKYGKILGFVKSTKKYIKDADVVFASSYLTMLNICQMGKPIFAVYTNPLKHDYLYSSPFSKYIYIYSNSKELSRGVKNYKINVPRLTAGQRWANSQTWNHVADTYEHLWRKE